MYHFDQMFELVGNYMAEFLYVQAALKQEIWKLWVDQYFLALCETTRWSLSFH